MYFIVANYVFIIRTSTLQQWRRERGKLIASNATIFALPARVSVRRKDCNQFSSATRNTISCHRNEHSAGTWTAHHLHTPAPHQQNVVQFCWHPPSPPVNRNKMADHINLPVIVPTQLSFAINKRTPGVCSGGFQQLVCSTIDGVIDDLRHGDDILVDGKRTGEYDQRTSSHRSGTSLVKEVAQPGPGPVLNPNIQYVQPGWPITRSDHCESQFTELAECNHSIKHSNSTGEEGLRKTISTLACYCSTSSFEAYLQHQQKCLVANFDRLQVPSRMTSSIGVTSSPRLGFAPITKEHPRSLRYLALEPLVKCQPSRVR